MTLPRQASPATASYGTENSQIAASQQSLKQIVASFKKLTALVPISNDLMRYADPAIDAMVRDDLVEVIALREDLAFMLQSMDITTGLDIAALLALRGKLANWLSSETLHGSLWRAGLPRTFAT